jgi:hypothetical protein
VPVDETALIVVALPLGGVLAVLGYWLYRRRDRP